MRVQEADLVLKHAHTSCCDQPGHTESQSIDEQCPLRLQFIRRCRLELRNCVRWFTIVHYGRYRHWRLLPYRCLATDIVYSAESRYDDVAVISQSIGGDKLW